MRTPFRKTMDKRALRRSRVLREGGDHQFSTISSQSRRDRCRVIGRRGASEFLHLSGVFAKRTVGRAIKRLADEEGRRYGAGTASILSPRKKIPMWHASGAQASMPGYGFIRREAGFAARVPRGRGVHRYDPRLDRAHGLDESRSKALMDRSECARARLSW